MSTMKELVIRELESARVAFITTAGELLAEAALRHRPNGTFVNILTFDILFCEAVGCGVASLANICYPNGKVQQVNVSELGVEPHAFFQIPTTKFNPGFTSAPGMLKVGVNAAAPKSPTLRAYVPDVQCKGAGTVYRKVKPEHCYTCGGELVRTMETIVAPLAQVYTCQDCKAKEFVLC